MMEFQLSINFKERTLIDIDDLWEKQLNFGTATVDGDSFEGLFIIAMKYGARFKTDSGKTGTLFGAKKNEGKETIYIGWEILLD
jgi:hypothetical protein